MNQCTRCLFGLAALAIVATGTFLIPGPPAGESLDDRSWAVESVMLLSESTTATYHLDPPLRVVRGGRVTFSRPTEGPALPVVRVDLTIDGEHVMVFAPLRQQD